MKVLDSPSSALAAPPPVAATQTVSYHTYGFMESELLPCVNLRRSVAALVLPFSWRVRLHEFFTRTARPLRIGIALSFFLAVGAVGAPSPAVGACLASLVLVLQLPSYIWLALTLRVELVRLLITTFDFWFFTLANLLCMVAGYLVLDDACVVMLPALWLGFQLATVIDASLYVDVHYTVSALLIALKSLAIALLMMAKESTTPDAASAHRVSVFGDFVLTYGSHSLSVSNVFANLLCTLAVLECRNGLRKWIALKVSRVTRDSLKNVLARISQRRNSSLTISTLEQLQHSPVLKRKRSGLSSFVPTNECIGYHCDVRLALLRGPRSSALNSALIRYVPERLKFVPIKDQIDSERVVLAWLSQYRIRVRFRVLHRTAQAVLQAAGAASLLSIVLVVLLPPHHTMAVLSCLALLGALVVFSVCVLFYQLQLLWRLFCTFDFVFLGIYSLVMHVCACDMLQWDHRCVAMAASWLWWLWVLAVDALTPVAKRKLALRLRCVAFVGLVALSTQMAIAIQYVTNADEYGFRDSRLFMGLPFVHNGGVCVCVVPVFFSCLVTVASLMVRILWRLTHLKPDVLVLIEGNVRYNVPAFRRPSSQLPPPPDPKAQVTTRTMTDNTQNSMYGHRSVSPLD